MLKSLLVALDGIADHRAAVASAVFLAARRGASVRVLLTVDLKRVAEPEAFGIGNAARHEHLETTLVEHLRAGVEAIRPAIEQALAGAGVAGEVSILEGDAEREVALEAQRHDLLVLSAALRRRRDEDAVELDYALQLDHLIKAVPGPILLADAEPLGDGPAFVAYDASTGAARALHALLHLGLAEGRPLHVVSVAGDAKEARGTAEHAASLAARYGLAAEAEGVVASDVGGALLARIEALRPALLVMGAYGRRTWREWLFGATTTALLDRVTCPVLVSH